ncbi:MAG TPA: helix-turn-helix domain-containing protein [Conexibacter sp.]|jgi:cytoskeleton protein RodZ|nr:helix-turn-helix domain-containing protein [Conexibacter sp.]
MPEIGPTLREARMRARIDITEVEQATKIRAKYLRALENEEWNLLPGSTFIKSFLREYADYLGLDARTLVEEYKLRYERPSEHELAPISPNLGRDRRGAGPSGPRVAPRWVIVGTVLVLVVVVLGLVGSLGGGGGSRSPGGTTADGGNHSARTGTTSGHTSTTAAPARASVRLVPTGTVYVCLVDGSGRVLIPGMQYAAGQHVPLYRARKLRMTLGNNAVQVRVNGRPLAVPASSTAIGYEITPTGAHMLPAGQAPTCT